MEMDNKTWLINEIVTSDMDAKAKADLVLMIKPLTDVQVICKGDVVQPINENETATLTVIKTFYLRVDYISRLLMTVCYNHETQDFCLIDHNKITDKNRKYVRRI